MSLQARMRRIDMRRFMWKESIKKKRCELLLYGFHLKTCKIFLSLFLDVSSLLAGLLSMEFVTGTPNLLERNKQIPVLYPILQES